MTKGNGGGPGQGSGEKGFDLPKAIAGSVLETPPAPQPGAAPIVDSGIIMLVANAADDMTQWGRQSKMRDRQLRDFIPTESMFASALGIVASRNAAFSWQVEGPKQLTAHVQDVLDHANMGKGWHDFILKVSVDLYTQDTGAFIEVIREGDRPEGALIGVNHLDAARCLGRDSRIRLGGDRRGKRKSVQRMVRDRDIGPVITVGRDGRIAEELVTGWHESKLDGRHWLRLIPARSRRGPYGHREGLWLTNDHRVLTPDGWIEAGDLRAGSSIVTDWPDLNATQEEVLAGTLLGDASLVRRDIPAVALGQSAAQRDWLECKMRALGGLGWSQIRGDDFLQATSHVSPALDGWHRDWYPGTRKRVDRRRVASLFSPRMLATWYGDDGTLQQGRWGRPTVRLYTQGFGKRDTEWLARLLTERGFEAVARPHRMRQGRYAKRVYWHVFLGVDAAEKLLRVVAPYLPASLRHKLPDGVEAYTPELWNCGETKAFVDTVLSIRHGINGGQVTAYCLDVEETHNFSAGGIIVHNCYHTGNPLQPVVYQDDVGKYHLLNWWQVVPLAELPSPDRRFKGLQWCALSRLMLAAQILKNTAVLQREKTGGRSTRSIHMVKGMTTQQITDAIEQVQIAADAAGLLRYLKPIIVGSTDPEVQLDVKTLDLASLPDGYDPDKQNKWYIAQMAMAFLTDYQEFAPLPGGNLGTSAQSEVLHMKSRGKGPGLFMGLITHALNFYILPRAVQFAYDEQDLSAEGEQADVQKKRAETRKIRVESGEYTPEAARQDALDAGDMTQELFDTLGGQDVTPNVIVRDDEQGEKSLEPLLKGLGARAAPVGQFLTTRIHRAFTTAADDLAALGYMDTPDRIKMSGLIGPVLKQLEDAMGIEVADIVRRNVDDDDARQVLAGMAQKAIGEEGSHSYRPFGWDATGTRAGDPGPQRAGPFEDERLAAEAVFQDDMEKWLARVFAEVKRRLREESAQATIGPLSFGFGTREIKPNMFDQPEFWGFAQEELVKRAGPHILQALLAGVQQAGRLGLAISFDQVNEQALKFAGDYKDDWWKQLKGSTQRGLRRAIQSNIKQGAPLSQLIKSLEPTFGRSRAEAIASTEITRMYAEANRMAYAEAGVGEVSWMTVNDAKVDPLCDALQGERWKIGDEQFVPPRHPGCRCWLAPVVGSEVLTRAGKP